MEVGGGQRLEAADLDLELALPIAVDITIDDGAVVCRAGLVEAREAELRAVARKNSSCADGRALATRFDISSMSGAYECSVADQKRATSKCRLE